MEPSCFPVGERSVRMTGPLNSPRPAGASAGGKGVRARTPPPDGTSTAKDDGRICLRKGSALPASGTCRDRTMSALRTSFPVGLGRTVLLRQSFSKLCGRLLTSVSAKRLARSSLARVHGHNQLALSRRAENLPERSHYFSFFFFFLVTMT